MKSQSVTELGTFIHRVLADATRGRGVASASVLDRTGTTPHTFWVPESAEEPVCLTYSVTKTFTATLVMQLCEERRLCLDDHLDRWYPRVARADRISLRRLLNHTSGMPDYGDLPAYHDALRSSPSTPWSFEQFADATFGKGLDFEPGHGWRYSNPGYMLLKGIVEEVTGSPYRDVIAERITHPLGLSRTFVPESIEELRTLAPGTSCVLGPDGARRDVRMHYHPGWVSHGVVASRTSDVVRFLDALVHGRLVSRRSMDEMLDLVGVDMAPTSSSPADEFPLRPGKPGYGLGLMGDMASPWGRLVGHNGGGPCYSTSAFHAVDPGVSICAMGAIEEDFSAEQIVADILDVVMNRETGHSR